MPLGRQAAIAAAGHQDNPSLQNDRLVVGHATRYFEVEGDVDILALYQAPIAARHQGETDGVARLRRDDLAPRECYVPFQNSVIGRQAFREGGGKVDRAGGEDELDKRVFSVHDIEAFLDHDIAERGDHPVAPRRERELRLGCDPVAHQVCSTFGIDRPLHVPVQEVAIAVETTQRHVARPRLTLDILSQGSRQLARVAGIAIAASGHVSQAAKRRHVLASHIETDNVNRETHALCRQLRAQPAWVALASLDPVGQQDDAACRATTREQSDRMPDGGGQGRLAPWRDAGNGTSGHLAIKRAECDQSLDIAAIAFFAVPIGDQPERGFRLPAVEHGGQHLLGDGNLGNALDLAPHAVRAVEDQNDVFVSLLGAERKGKNS